MTDDRIKILHELVRDGSDETAAITGAILDAIPDFVYVKDVSKRYRLFNRSFCRWLGVAPEEISGADAGRFHSPVIASIFESEDDRVLAGESIIGIEEFVARPGERGRWFRKSKTPLRDASGKVIGIVCVGTDIGELKAAEEHVRRQETIARLSLDAARLTAWEWDVEREEVRYSGDIRELLGFDPGPAHMPVDEAMLLIHENDRPRMIEAAQRSTESGEDYAVEFRSAAPGQEHRTFVTRGRSERSDSGRPTRVYGVTWEITRLKQSEHRLVESERLHRLLFESAPMPLWVYDRESLRFLAVNDAAIERYGYSRDEFLAMTLKDIRPPEDVSRLLAVTLQNSVNRLQPTIWRHRRKNGEVFWVEVTSHGIEFDGRDARIVLATDVDERENAARELREAEAKYRALFEQSPDGVVLIDPLSERILDANRALCTMLGRTKDSLVNQPLSMIECDLANGTLRIASSDPGHDEFETFLGHASGRRVAASVTVRRLTLAGEPRLHVVIRDMTERHRIEARLRESQKLEAVGRLASGVAHDFNNLLSAIFAYVGLARSSAASRDPALAAALDGLDAASVQAAGVSRSLLTFARRSTPQVVPLDLVSVLRDATKLVRASLPANINVQLQTPPTAVRIRGDGVQLMQALVNLALNARDAMPTGGTLSFVLGAPTPAADGSHFTLLRVVDSGSGMTPEVQARAFEPFFSTKPPEDGTGLGLAIVRGIVESHGGLISVTSDPGRETAFEIRLPCEPARPAVESIHALATPRALILAVASTRVRQVLASALRSDGHLVHEAGDLASLQQLQASHAGQIDATIVDADPSGPPVCTAREAEAAVRSGRLILLWSGPLDLRSAATILRKPFQVADLVAALAGDTATRE